MPDDPMTQLSTRIPVSLQRRLKIHCLEQEITMNDFIITALEAKLKKAAAHS